MLVLVFSCWKEVRACLGENRPPVFDFSCSWQIGQRSCQLLICGMGPLLAFQSLCLFLRHRDVSGVVNFGLAGAYDKKQWSLGEVALITHEIWPDDEPEMEGSSFCQQLAVSSRELECTNPSVFSDLSLQRPDWKEARSVTVLQPSCPERGRGLCQRFRGDVENMEGFALALACQMAGVPFLEIRTIANFVGETERNKIGFSRACPALHTALAELEL